MSFDFNINQINGLMKSFYELTGVRFVLFDSDFKEILSFPKQDCEFCKIIKSIPQTRRKCILQDKRFFKKSQETGSPVVYKCHAKLVEAVIPLYENTAAVGYLMFGQITDSPDKNELYQNAELLSEKYDFNYNMLAESIDKIIYKPQNEILSAAKIMEACTSYIIYKELITPNNSKILTAVKDYIEENLSGDLSIETLCGEFKISRTKLYNIFKDELKIGISKYIMLRRLHHAKKLLKITDLSVNEISNRVGFSDYNYFSRVFKKYYNKSPKYYRTHK